MSPKDIPLGTLRANELLWASAKVFKARQALKLRSLSGQQIVCVYHHLVGM